MFTGLIQAVGKVVEAGEATTILAPSDWKDDPFKLGESVAVNGCCLTVVTLEALTEGTKLGFDLSKETLDRTALGGLAPESTVNLERAMRPIDRFGGHIVQGHVDGVGDLLTTRTLGEFEVFRFRVPQEGVRYLIDKGSIAIDGISLTVVEPVDGEFDVWLIPHTLSHTNLGTMEPGTKVNLEYDVLAKHVEKLLSERSVDDRPPFDSNR